MHKWHQGRSSEQRTHQQALASTHGAEVVTPIVSRLLLEGASSRLLVPQSFLEHPVLLRTVEGTIEEAQQLAHACRVSSVEKQPSRRVHLFVRCHNGLRKGQRAHRVLLRRARAGSGGHHLLRRIHLPSCRTGDLHLGGRNFSCGCPQRLPRASFRKRLGSCLGWC